MKNNRFPEMSPTEAGKEMRKFGAYPSAGNCYKTCICHLLLQLTKPLLKLQGGEGQGDIRGQAGCRLRMRQVFLGA